MRPEDRLRGWLAVLVVGGGFFLVALAWFVPTGREPAVLLGPLFALIGGVLGHFFGARGRRSP